MNKIKPGDIAITTNKHFDSMKLLQSWPKTLIGELVLIKEMADNDTVYVYDFLNHNVDYFETKNLNTSIYGFTGPLALTKFISFIFNL